MGGPDMAKEQDLLEKKLKTSTINISSVSNNNLGSYLAGLFEGDGHI